MPHEYPGEIENRPSPLCMSTAKARSHAPEREKASVKEDQLHDFGFHMRLALLD
jgi:hypothetical protein